MTAEQDKAYQAMFDAFVEKHKLDIEYDNWPADLEAKWQANAAEFYARQLLFLGLNGGAAGT